MDFTANIFQITIVLTTNCLIFVRLERMILNENKFSKVEAPAKDEFIRLEQLSLNNNEIENWESIDHLDQFSNLKQLRFVGNKVIGKDLSPSNVRKFVIGRISKLTHMNGSDVFLLFLASHIFLDQKN